MGTTTMVDLEDVSTSADTGEDSTLDADANRFVDRTYNEDNYQKWADQSEATTGMEGDGGLVSPAEALQNRYGFGDDEVDSYADLHEEETMAAIEEGRYESGLETFATEGEADDAWAQRFVSGIQNAGE
jgi:hypothetical protein